MSFFNELKRRNVIRVGLGYLASAWLLMQIVETLFSLLDLPPSYGRIVVILLAVGFVPTLVFAWVFEWTPGGLVRDQGTRDAADKGRQRNFDRVVMVLLALAVTYFSVDKFVLDPARDRERETEVARQARSEALIDSFADKSIVVLPFVNLSDDEDTEYFADGMTEELLNLLARIPDLRVISRSTSFVYKGQAVKASEVAEQLDVTYVLEGSVRKAGPTKWRITAQLIDGRSDHHVWSDTYDNEFEIDEIFEVQDEIANRIVDEMALELLNRDDADIDPGAYEIALQVNYLLNLYDREKVPQIEELIDQGLELEPDYATLLSARHRLLTHKVSFQMITAEERDTEQAAIDERLRELVPDDPRWLWQEALATPDNNERARIVAEIYRLHMTDLDVVEGVSRFARFIGRFDIAAALNEYLLDREPFAGRLHFRQGGMYDEAGRFDNAIESFEKAALYDSGGLQPHQGRGAVYLHSGRPEQALQAYAKVQLSDPGIALLSKVFTLMAEYDLGVEDFDGRRRQWETAVQEYIANQDDPGLRDNFEGNYEHVLAVLAAWTGDADTAIDHLEEDVENYLQSPNESDIAKLFCDRDFQRIWDDPRWHELMERMGTTDEDLVAIEFDITLPPGYELDETLRWPAGRRP